LGPASVAESTEVLREARAAIGEERGRKNPELDFYRREEATRRERMNSSEGG